MNDFYTPTGAPSTSSQGSSSTMRSEFNLIEDAFDKLPTLTGNGGEIIAVNSGATALEAITTTGTGSGVRATSPTLVTPTIGVATATSINKVAITAPASSATLTIADGKTLTASNTLTFTGTDGSSVAFGAGGTVAYTANKLSAFAATTSAELRGVISDESGTGSLLFQNGALGTPASGTLTNCSGLPTTGIASVTASAAELNILDGATCTANDLKAMGDGSLTLASGVSVGNVGFVRRGVDGLTVAGMYLSTTGSWGGKSNVIATLPAGFRPTVGLFTHGYFVDATDSQRKGIYVSVGTDGTIMPHETFSGGSDIAGGDTFAFYTAFPTR